MKVSDLKNKALIQACEDYQVKELYLFGSGAAGNLSRDSDLDFLVVFNRKGYKGAFDQYMGLKERLERIYDKPVDLLQLRKFKKPLFQEEIEKSKILLYAA